MLETEEDLKSTIRLLKSLSIQQSYHIQLLQERIINLEGFMSYAEKTFEDIKESSS